MPLVLILSLSLHVLAAVFWAGTTFVLARGGGAGAERLLRPQMGAALLAILMGAYLWRQLHDSGFGGMERVLALGALAALLAAAVQGFVGARVARRLRERPSEDVARANLLAAQRVAAVLLAIAVVCMTIARYF